MPASRAATAICSAPLECPSRPGLATSRRGGPPGRPLTRAATAASSSDRPPAAARRRSGPGTRRRPRAARRPTRRSCRRPGQRDRGRHDVVGPATPPPAARRAPRCTAGESRAARQALDVGDHLRLDRRIDLEDRLVPAQRGRRVSVNRLTPTTTCSPGLDAPGALGHRAHQPALQLVDGLERAAQGEHVLELGLAASSRSSAVRASTTWSRRRCRRTRAGRTRRPAPVASATTTAGPTASAGRAPRSTPAAGRCGPGPASTA